jgi:hypothetical protein
MTTYIGQRIRLKRLFKGVASGSIGVITGPCGCGSNPGWTVAFAGHGEVVVHMRNTQGYEHYEFVG